MYYKINCFAYSYLGTLTFVIGIFLTYIGLVMMTTDQLSALRNQNKVGQIYERIRTVDEKLFKEGYMVNNSMLQSRTKILILLSFAFEITIMLSTFITLIERKWISLLWVFSCVPTLFNSLDKIWFAITLHALQERFSTINNALNDMVLEHQKYKSTFKTEHLMKSAKDQDTCGAKLLITDVSNKNLDFFYAELNKADNLRYKIGKSRIKPLANSLNNFNTHFLESKNIDQMKSHLKIMPESELNNLRKVEIKLNNFCQLHDEICEIGKVLNELWSYSILVLMAHGFLIFTAQLYFLYCATQNQVSSISNV